MGKSPEKHNLRIPGPVGDIEALLEIPLETTGRRVAVICHPHPQFQGTMLNKVVHTLARTMNDLGMPALRFNFRGVGASDGAWSGGIAEAADAEAVIDWARQRYPAANVWLAGFSFGAMVASRVAARASVERLITVAPAVGLLADTEFVQPEMPWLIVQGEDDDVVSCAAVIAWVNSLEPGPQLLVLPGVGHFFHGHLMTLKATLLAQLQGAIP